MKNEPTQFFDKEPEITFARRKREGSIFKAFMHPAIHISSLVVCLLMTTLSFFAPEPIQYLGYVFSGLSVLFAGLLIWRVIKEIINSVDL